MNAYLNDKSVLIENYKCLDNMFSREILENSLKWYCRHCQRNSKDWVMLISQVLDKLKFEQKHFPVCNLSINQLGELLENCHIKFPISFYATRDNINVIPQDGKLDYEHSTKYNNIKAYECLIRPIRFSCPDQFPVCIRTRLLYLPTKTLKFTLTGNKKELSNYTIYDCIIESIDETPTINREGLRLFWEKIKFVPFELLKDIMLKRNITKSWCEMVGYNYHVNFTNNLH